MNKISKLIGIMAFIAVIGFTMTACGELSERSPKMVRFTITGVSADVTLTSAKFSESAADALFEEGSSKTLTKEVNGDCFCTVEAGVYYIVVTDGTDKYVYAQANPLGIGFTNGSKTAITAAQTAYDSASDDEKGDKLIALGLAKAAVGIPSLSLMDSNSIYWNRLYVVNL